MIPSVVVVVIFLLAVGVVVVLAGRSRRRSQLEDRVQAIVDADEVRELPERWQYRESRLPSWMRGLGRNARRAGFGFGGFEVLLAVLLGGLAGALTAQILIGSYAWLAIGTAMGAYVPLLLLGMFARRRVFQLELQLAGALDSMAASLKAGVGLRQAIEGIREHHQAPLARELDEVLSTMDSGATPAEALRESAQLLHSAQYDLFAVTLAAKWETGGGLSPVLRSLAERIRSSVRLRRRVKTLTAEARFSAIILFLMPLLMALLIWYAAPGNLDYLLAHPFGWIMFQIALAMQVLGFLWTLNLLRPEEDR